MGGAGLTCGTMRTSLVKRLGELLLLGATFSALGCSGKDATKCQEALNGTRKSLAAGDVALTGQWRTRAYTYCEDKASLSTLDKQIVDQQASEAATKAAEAERKAQNEGLLKAFTSWAGDNRAAPDHASAAPKCDGDDADAGAPKAASTDPKAKERFCTATRSAGTTPLTARYWEADKTLELFTLTPPGPVSCDDLGPNKVLKSWDVPAKNNQSVKRTRCELGSGALAGMNAVVSAANNAPVYIFSPGYLTKDAALKKIAGE
jgi:hypothetical protein